MVLATCFALKRGTQDDLSSGEDGRVHGHAHAKAMEQRQDSQYPLFVGEMTPGDDLVSIGHEVKVRKHDALGNARGAAAIDQHSHFVWLNRLWMTNPAGALASAIL